MVLFFTAISVSIDAYAAGFAYGMTKKIGVLGALYAGVITFLACLIAGVFKAFFIENVLYFNLISGLTLSCIGIKYMLDSRKNVKEEKSVSGLTALGFFVSVDAAIACLAMEGGVVSVALLMGQFHAVFLYLGAVSARPLPAIGNLTFLSGAFLFLLGIKRAAW